MERTLLLQKIIDNSFDFLLAFDLEGNLLEFNIHSQKLFNCPIEKAVKKKDFEFFLNEPTYRVFKTQLMDKGFFSGGITFKDKNNKTFNRLVQASLISDKKKVKAYVIYGKNADKLEEIYRKAEDSEKIYRDLFEKSTNLIQIIDLEGNILHVNNAWHRTLGYRSSELHHLNIKDLWVENESVFKNKSIKDLLISNKKNKLKVVVFKCKSGNEYILEGNSTLNYKNGKPIAIRSIFRDITDIRKAIEKNRLNAARLNAIFNSKSHLFWIVDKRFCLTTFNKNFAEGIKNRYGYYPELNKDYSSPKNYFSTLEIHELWNRKYKKAFEGNVVNFETNIIDKEGNELFTETFLNPILTPSGEVNEVSGIAHDITFKKIAEKRIREQNARINSIFESADNMFIFSFDRNYKILSFNRNFAKVLTENHGLTIKNGIILNLEELSAIKEYRKKIKKSVTKAFRGLHTQLEMSLYDLKGKKEWYEVIFNPIYLDTGEILEISCMAFEITQKKKNENKLRATVKEKEILLKEVHHRVKNNLQVISSILSLQSNYVTDKKILEILKESQDRIKTMSFIHESLYQNTDFTSIKLDEYILNLTQNLVYSYKIEGRLIEVKTSFDKIHLNIDQAIPCGLIINELISNALKHAFPGLLKGEIFVGITKKQNLIKIKIKDNGVGFPKNMNNKTTDTLGFQLVYALVEQLDGTIQINSKKGTEYLINFERTSK